MSDSTTSKMITLKSNDGVLFEVSETVAMQFQTIRHIIEDGFTMTYIPLPNVDALILEKVIEYCMKHVDAADEAPMPETTKQGIRSSTTPASSRLSAEELRNWDKQFVDVDLEMLLDLIMAANYLHIEGLQDVTTQRVADMMKGKSPEDIRQTFNIKNDFAPEEEEEIRHEFKWALSHEN